MNGFKFLTGEPSDLIPQMPLLTEQEMVDMSARDFEDTDPSWMWAYEMGVENFENMELVTVECRGIMEFLFRFPRHFIVPMVSISCNGIVHTYMNSDEGWGFDIRNDLITFVYLRI